MAVNGEMFKNKEHRHWPLFLILLAFCGLSCPALLITTPWQRSQAQGRFVPVSLHSDQTADYTQNLNPPLFPAVRMDIVWDAILDRDPSAAQTLAQRQAQLQASLDEEIKVSSSVCQGQYLVPAAFDTWVDSANPGRANPGRANPGRANPGNTAGDDTILQLGRADDDLKRVLLYFPVEEMLPGGPFIYRARLELRLTDPAAPKPATAHIFNLTQPFTETTTTWLNQPGSHIDTLPPTHSAANVHTWDMTEFVRSWLLGHYANHGIMLELPPGLNMDLRYYSREADTHMNFDVSDSSLAPRLVIDCSPAPEPTAVAAQPTPVPGPPTSGDEDIPPAANATQTPPPVLPATPTPFVLPTATPPATLLPTPTEWPVLPTPTTVLPAPTLLPTDTPIALPTDTPVPPTSKPATSTPVPATATSTPIPPTATFTPVPPQADVGLSKSDSPDPVMSGSVLTYQLTVTNNGPAQATGVSVTDSLPAGVTLISTTASQGTCTGTTCNLGALASGGSASVTIRVTVNAASGTLNNTAQVSANETDPNPGNNSASTGTTITAAPSADLSISKSDSPDPVLPGANLTYSLNVANAGPSAASNVTLVDTLPTGVTWVSTTPSQGTCSGTTTITCNMGDIAGGGSATVDIVVTVDAGTTGTLNNSASVSASEADPNTGNNSATAGTTVSVPTADLSITKSDSPDPVLPGDNLTYTLNVTNNGPANATGVTVVDTLPAGVTLVSATSTQGSCSGTTTITCNIGNLANGSSETVTIEVTVDLGTTGTLNNSASVSANETDPNTSNNSASAGTTVSVPTADLSITKSDSPDPVLPGNNLTYTLNVANAGPSAASNVTLVDTLPAGVTWVSTTPSQGTCSGTTTITCNMGAIAGGGSETVTIVVNVDAGTTGTLNNTASVSATETDPDTANNTAIALTTVTTPNSADLLLSKADAPDPVTPGSNLTYTLDVDNNGPDNATGVTVVDTLPAGVTLVSATWPTGSCSGTTIITCNMGAIANGGSETVTIVVNVDAGTTGTLNNSASVSANEADPNTADNIANAATTINTNADLSLTKSDSPDPVLPGDNLTYTLNVTNNGPANATGVTVVDTLPAGVTLVSATWPTGSCTGAVTLTCNLGNLANGSGETITIVVSVGAGTTGTLNNSATVSGSQPDPNAANNTASAGTTVNVVADLSITKSDSPDPVLSGGSLTYTINVANNGPANATGVTVVDTLPGGVTLVSATPSQGSCAGTTCTLGNLAGGSSATVTIVVTVNAASGTLSNSVSVSANETDSNLANNSVTQDTTITTDADLSITKTDSPDPVVIGNDLTYTLTIANTGPADATGVVVTDTLPASGINNIVPDAGCSETGGIVTCIIGNLAAGSSIQRTIMVGVNASAGNSLTNQAEVSGDQPDPTPANNTTTITTTVAEPGADIEVTKTVDIPAPVEGATIVYTIIITNNGPQNATGVQVADLLPTGVTYVSDDGGGDYSDASGLWNPGNLAVGTSATLHITATVDAGTGGSTINNTATGSAVQSDPDNSNNSATASISVASPLVDLALTGLVNNPTPVENEAIMYTVSVTNNGPDNATGVIIESVFPGGIAYVAATATQGSYAPGTGLWNVGNLNNTAGASLWITATVDAGTAGTTLDTTVSVHNLDQTDPVAGNDAVTVPITVTSTLCFSPDITITTPNGQDTWVRSNNENPNNTDTILQIRPNSASPIFHGLVQFDLTSIPPGTPITCAALLLRVQTATSAAQTVYVDQVSENWLDSQATWTYRLTGTPWTIPGGTSSSTLGNFVPDTTGVKEIGLTAVVQDWINNSGTNYGVLLRSDTTGDNGAVVISSLEGANPPLLVIQY